MIVMKFGGTSVGSAAHIRALAARVDEWRSHYPMVVVSALAGVTDLLVRGAHRALRRESDGGDVVGPIGERHQALVAELITDDAERARLRRLIDDVAGELHAFYTAVRALGELTPRTLDAISAVGERLSAEIVAAALQESGISAAALDARRVLVTDDSFGRAQPLMAETKARLEAALVPLIASDEVPVLGGFIGATRDGITTTLGRGGSDYSAAIFGAVRGAREIQIWTDVDGMMTVDPRVVPGARVLPEVSFEEAAELAYFGARVLHPATIKPAVERGIPVRVLNSLNPKAQGTLIAERVEAGGRGEPRAVAFKKGITVVLISQPRMLMAYGFVARVFEVFDRYRTPVDLIATSEVSISLTVDDAGRLPAVEAELAGLGDVRTLAGMAIVSVVGRGFNRQPGLAGRVFQALREVNVVMISFGASDVNLSFVVAEGDAESAVRLIHREFFE